MAVLPNGSGRRMTGVVSLSGAVRSMTWMPPSLIAVVRSVSRDMRLLSWCWPARAAGMPPRPDKRRGRMPAVTA